MYNNNKISFKYDRNYSLINILIYYIKYWGFFSLLLNLIKTR